jgi:acyl dehydratase
MDYETIKSWPFPDVVHSYDERETMLYALAVGYGCDPLDERQLRYVYEDALTVAPSMASILGHPGTWMLDPATGIDGSRVVHAEQTITLHGALRPAATVIGRNRIAAIVDKGAGRGAIIYQERSISDRESGALLATVEHVNFARGDGGLERSDPGPPAMEGAPERTPDAVCDLPTIPQAALLYRLLGDRNPLHADPARARQAGFDRPILHGLCTFGVAVHALQRTFTDYDPTALRRIGARFSAPVLPGETVRVEMWREERIRFRARVLERDSLVLSGGHAELAP